MVLLSSSVYAEDILNASGHPEYPPIMWREGNRIVGVGVKLVETVFNELGVEVKSQYIGPWNRVQASAKYGVIDVIVAAYKNPERETYMDYSEPYMDDPVVVFVKRGNAFSFNHWRDLIGKTGSSTIGDSYGAEFDDFMANKLNIIKITDVRQNFDLLEIDRIDYSVFGLYPGLLTAERLGFRHKIEVLPTRVTSKDFYFTISKKSKFRDYLPKANKIIKRLRDSGIIDTWINQYLDTYRKNQNLPFSEAVIAQPVNICDGNEEWPPYIYYSRVEGKPDTEAVVGATVDLLDEVFKLINMQHSITLIPWKRCTHEVLKFDGKKHQFEAFANGSFSFERAEKYYISIPIYTTHQGVFYSKSKFPTRPPLQKASDLNHYKICGVHGYNYEMLYKDFGLVRDKKIYTLAKTPVAVLKMITQSKCDVFVNSIEPIYGGPAIGAYQIPPDIAHILIPGASPSTFHIYVSKNSPRAFELITKLNKAIIMLQKNGVSKSIFAKYLPLTED